MFQFWKKKEETVITDVERDITWAGGDTSKARNWKVGQVVEFDGERLVVVYIRDHGNERSVIVTQA